MRVKDLLEGKKKIVWTPLISVIRGLEQSASFRLEFDEDIDDLASTMRFGDLHDDDKISAELNTKSAIDDSAHPDEGKSISAFVRSDRSEGEVQFTVEDGYLLVDARTETLRGREKETSFKFKLVGDASALELKLDLRLSKFF